jgi:hypothetical protein
MEFIKQFQDLTHEVNRLASDSVKKAEAMTVLNEILQYLYTVEEAKNEDEAQKQLNDVLNIIISYGDQRVLKELFG